ncbi:MAG: 50S ribosomal protein L24 [Patescibacteria group bacterium]
MAATLKKSDTVIVLSGKDAGKKGKILRVFPSDHKILVEGVNEQKRHQRPSKSNQKGQIVTKLSPIHISNALYYCSKCGKGVRMGAKMIGDKKVRACKGCGVELA